MILNESAGRIYSVGKPIDEHLANHMEKA